jgi:head-tail adaptor
MIAGGQFDRRITLQRPGTVTDGEYGQVPGDWVDVFSRVPAQVWDTLPGRAEATGEVLSLAERPARVRMRYVRGITSDMRVVLHNETDSFHQISAGPAEIGRREFIEFTIREYSS